MADTEAPADRQRIVNITLDEQSVVRRSAEVEHERRVAIFDLLENNHFSPVDVAPGPYHLHLAIEDNRLVLQINDTDDKPITKLVLPMTSYRRLIKDYFTGCAPSIPALDSPTPIPT